VNAQLPHFAPKFKSRGSSKRNKKENRDQKAGRLEGHDNWQSRGRSGRDEEARDSVQWEYAKRIVVGFVSATTRQLRPSHFRVLRVLVNAVGCRLLTWNDCPSRKRHVLDPNSRIASAAVLNETSGYREQRSFGSMCACECVTSSSRSSSSLTFSFVFHDTTHLLDLAWQGCRQRVTKRIPSKYFLSC
jgi:hypothetical protein